MTKDWITSRYMRNFKLVIKALAKESIIEIDLRRLGSREPHPVFNDPRWSTLPRGIAERRENPEFNTGVDAYQWHLKGAAE